MTPWGGEKLRLLYSKDSPGPHAGESLELSAIPGLESRAEDGRTLSQLIVQYGQALTGTKVGNPFPLLVKLIDAKEQLSVQVHPDDDYAQAYHGKPGKNEAWVILDCEPDARLIIGLKGGINHEQLLKALEKNGEIESCLRTVKVSPGEVYSIPAGTIHAIGKGLVLYEIQQSSDVTYRLYDWGRLDKNGKGRELHPKQSLDVVKYHASPLPALPKPIKSSSSGVLERLLDTPFFLLDRLRETKGFVTEPDLERFRVLTAVKPMTIHWDSGELPLSAGQTALLPADGFSLSLSGESALLAAPDIS
jgi:mannose-6-phosphate isomerase